MRGHRSQRWWFPAGLALIGLLCTFSAFARELPSDSVYRLDATLTDQTGRDFAFADRAGDVTLATLFYASCPYTCPLLIEQLRRIERQLDDAERARLAVLLISLDPDKDTPAALALLARQRRLDTGRWTLAQPQAADLRKLAALLDVQYRALPDGNFNHSTTITLLDRHGRVLASSGRLGEEPEEEFMHALRQALASDQPSD